MKKSEFLAHWASLRQGLNIGKHFKPVPAKTTGSRYGACGIRIEGNPDFVDAVLSRIKDVVDLENDRQRLQASYSKVTDNPEKDFHNKDDDAVVVYIRLAERSSK